MSCLVVSFYLGKVAWVFAVFKPLQVELEFWLGAAWAYRYAAARVAKLKYNHIASDAIDSRGCTGGKLGCCEAAVVVDTAYWVATKLCGWIAAQLLHNALHILKAISARELGGRQVFNVNAMLAVELNQAVVESFAGSL